MLMKILIILSCVTAAFAYQIINNAHSHRSVRSIFGHGFRLRSMIDCPAGEFESLVVKAEVPVVVDFFANWCGPCKLVGPIFKQVAEDFPADKVKFVKVDTDVHEDTVDKYNIQGLPLFGLFIDGEIVQTHSGAMNKDALKEFVNSGLQKFIQKSALA